MRILIADDEKKIASFVQRGLADSGFDASTCHDGEAAFRLATSQSFDALVLDIMMPDRDGLTVLGQLRAQGNQVPVIFLTARDGVADRIDGLNLGADDYITKPFSIDELIARLRAVRRRLSGERLHLLQFGDLTLDIVTREVRRGGRKLDLTVREFALIEYLLRFPDRVHTRNQLCERVWSYRFDPGTNLVDVAIQRLRRKIDQDQPVKLLQTVRGVGYTLRAVP
jgi:DNA-binding response OmpR family regulator